jgi:predicted Zn-dependent protease
VESWQRALLRDPTNWLSVFYLSQGYFAVGRYQEAVTLLNNYAAGAHDPIFLSIIYCNLGDSSTMLGKYDDAHRAYSNSYRFEYLRNPRGLKSLIGP